MQTLLQDLKHSLRMFRENPGFTLTAVTALMLGIGANTAIFSVVNAVLLKPVPFDEPDRLVRMMNTTKGNMGGSAASPAKFQHWREQTDVLEDVAAFRNNSLNYSSGDIPERVTAAQVSEAYLRTFRAPIIMGRNFSPEEDSPNGPKVTLISYNFWTRRLNSDPDIIGKSLRLSGDSYTVIGIVGEGFDMREFGQPDLFVPFQLDPNTTDQGHYFSAAARLKPDVTIEQAQARLEASATQYREKFPLFDKDNGFSVLSFQESIVGPGVKRTLLVLLGAVGFVLLIACANVANLLLVRATGRRREIAIRSALGAGRRRIVRQLLTESVLLSVAGGALGLVGGFLGMRALLAVNTAGLPRLGEEGSLMGMDWRVVSFTLGLSLLTGILFGLVPSLVGSRSDLNAVIKDSSSRSGTGFRQNKTRSLLVMLEVGLAVVLLVGAALLIRTSVNISKVDPGFDATNVLTMRTSLTGPQYQTAAGVDQIATTALDRLRAMPGIAAATATCCVPLQGGYGLPFNIVGRVNEGPSTGGGSWIVTTAGYFETFGIPIVRGRAFDQRDGAAGPPVVIINEAMAKRFWDQGADPLQDRLYIGGGIMRELQGEPERQIIGIAGDVRNGSVSNEPGPAMFVPQGQVTDAINALNLGISPMAWVVRTQGDSAALASAVQEELRQTLGLPVTNVQSMEEVVAISSSRQRLNMLLMTVFGCSALLLAAIGIYGLMAYSVQQRTQEIGIRLALGAGSGQVKNMIIRQGMLLVIAGALVGLGSAFYLANLMATLLYEVEPRDVPVFVAVPVVLTLIALAAVWVPARRASQVDPLEALRYE